MSQAAPTTSLGEPGSNPPTPEMGWTWESQWACTDDATRVEYFRDADVPFYIVYIGSSSSVYDRRTAVPCNRPDMSAHTNPAPRVAPLSVIEGLEELMAALALNKSLLARILRVSRPTIYEWFAGKAPKQTNEERLQSILDILAQGAVNSSTPLNARFVRRPRASGSLSLVDLLTEERIDPGRVIAAINDARALSEDAKRRQSERDGRLRDLGFEEPVPEQRRETLARNVALLEWPKE